MYFSDQHQLAWNEPWRKARTGLSYLGFFLFSVSAPNIKEKKSSLSMDLDGGRHDMTSAFVPLPNGSCCVTASGPKASAGDDSTTDALISAADDGKGTLGNAFTSLRRRARRDNSEAMSSMIVA